MNRIAIIGLGLIGGSIGLGLKQAKLKEIEIVGHDRDAETAGRAKRRGAIDQVEWNLIAAVRTADMVIIATPAMAIREIFSVIADHLPEQCVVTDTASTKVQVMAWAQELLPKSVYFVGGHPMAGKETPGIDAADPALFQETLYCIIPALDAPRRAVESVVGLARTLGAKPYFVDTVEHDGFAAGVSHLPLVASAALVSTVSKSPAWREMSRMAASGFEGVSRLASGDHEMSRDICLSNQESIARWIDSFIEELRRYRELILSGGQELERAFLRAQMARDKWLAQRAGAATEEPQVEIPTAAQAMEEVFLGRGLRRLFTEPRIPPKGPPEKG